MKFCSFSCEESSSDKAQHAACLAVNGVHCNICGHVVEKGQLCPVEDEYNKKYNSTEKKMNKT